MSGAVVLSATELHLGRGWLTSEYALVKHVNQNDANGYYRALGLSPDASKEDIKSAYRRLLKVLHPDKDGDEELFMFLSDVVGVLLNDKSKVEYDSVGEGSVYLGDMEREELARLGLLEVEEEKAVVKRHWACLTTAGFLPGKDTDAWSELCRQASLAVGYRGKIRVGVLEVGRYWPGQSSPPWGISIAGPYTFVIFQRGVEPNRLHALCGMIDLQKHLQKQI